MMRWKVLLALVLLTTARPALAGSERPAPVSPEAVHRMTAPDAWLQAIPVSIDDYHAFVAGVRALAKKRPSFDAADPDYSALRRRYADIVRMMTEHPIVRFSGTYDGPLLGEDGAPFTTTELFTQKVRLVAVRISTRPVMRDDQGTTWIEHNTFELFTAQDVQSLQRGDRVEAVAVPMAVVDGDLYFYGREIRKLAETEGSGSAGQD